jgi:hypothetical protein
MQTEPVSLKWANFLLPNKQALYDTLVEKKMHLPKFESKACNAEYLLRCMRGEVFTIKEDQIKVCHMKRKASKAVLITILRELAKMDLGFDILSPPNKQWLLDCIHALCPEHDIFKNPAIDGITRELPKGKTYLLKELFVNCLFLLSPLQCLLIVALTDHFLRNRGFLQELPVPFKRPRGKGLFKKTKSERKKKDRNRALNAAENVRRPRDAWRRKRRVESHTF